MSERGRGVSPHADGPADEPAAELDETVDVADATVPVAAAARRRATYAVAAEPGAEGLDPERRIAPVPGRGSVGAPPREIAGAGPFLPVAYGARPVGDAHPAEALDEVALRLGPPPPPTAVPVREGREALPSLGARERRSRIATLIAYPVVVLLAVAGLVAVAVIAFA